MEGKPTHSFLESNGTIFPMTTFPNGIVVVDYPSYDPNLAKKITEQGQEHLRKLQEVMDDIRKKHNIQIIVNDKPFNHD